MNDITSFQDKSRFDCLIRIPGYNYVSTASLERIKSLFEKLIESDQEKLYDNWTMDDFAIDSPFYLPQNPKKIDWVYMQLCESWFVADCIIRRESIEVYIPNRFDNKIDLSKINLDDLKKYKPVLVHKFN